jgi:formamidopyrimidine-DNA glycosylase
MKLISIKQSNRKGKKLMATFSDGTTTHFGAEGYSDFTQHKDEARKQRYINRHTKNENWNNYKSAGALSRWILWNKSTLSASIKDYKKKFNL